VSCLAKGAYRLQSGYCGVLDLFDTLRVSWRVQRGSDLALLSEAAIQERRRGILRDLAGYQRALSVLELAAQASRAGLGDPELFDITRAALERLERGAVDPEVALAVFELRFLGCLGLNPALGHCAACGAPPAAPRGRDPRVPFAASEGGRLCPACARAARASGRRVGGLPLAALRIAESLLATPEALLARVRVAPAALSAVRGWIAAFTEYHLEHPRRMGPRMQTARGARRRVARAR
jgi:DNA repair protein RecO (recombination protein O)